jgi:hypothetical protein
MRRTHIKSMLSASEEIGPKRESARKPNMMRPSAEARL